MLVQPSDILKRIRYWYSNCGQTFCSTSASNYVLYNSLYKSRTPIPFRKPYIYTYIYICIGWRICPYGICCPLPWCLGVWRMGLGCSGKILPSPAWPPPPSLLAPNLANFPIKSSVLQFCSWKHYFGDILIRTPFFPLVRSMSDYASGQMNAHLTIRLINAHFTIRHIMMYSIWICQLRSNIFNNNA